MTAVETQIDDLLAELRPILIDLTACGYSVDSLASAMRPVPAAPFFTPIRII